LTLRRRRPGLRGIACLIVDGPGGGSIRFRTSICITRPNATRRRHGVKLAARPRSTKRIGVVAISLGSCYAPRRRLRAALCLLYRVAQGLPEDLAERSCGSACPRMCRLSFASAHILWSSERDLPGRGPRQAVQARWRGAGNRCPP
jgi:hypothetical protein